VNNPYEVLGLAADATDDTIRRRYLELVRQHSPERDPEKFAQIRAAYEHLRDGKIRLHHRLFEAGEKEHISQLIEELSWGTRRRLSLKELLSVAQAP
jgi:curved DNA-binding protein CbpA